MSALEPEGFAEYKSITSFVDEIEAIKLPNSSQPVLQSNQ